MRKYTFVVLLSSLISFATTCTVSGSVTASASTCSSLVSGDTMRITGTLSLNADYTVHAANNIVVIVDGGSIVWNGNVGFDLGSGASLYLINGGALVSGTGSCNANKVISFGGTDISSCNGGGAGSSFADVTAAGGVTSGGPVPVSLIDFTYEIFNTSKVKLNWSTASELNNEFFFLLRSVDGLDFQEIYRTAGQGTSTNIHNYSFSDNPPSNSSIFYRLVQQDYDGKIVELKTIKISLTINPIIVYPNPFNNELHIDVTDESEITTVKIINSNGQVQINKVLKSEDNIIINTSELSPGLYILSINNQIFKLFKD